MHPPHFSLLRNSRKTERGAGQFLTRLAVRAALFALLWKLDRPWRRLQAPHENDFQFFTA